MQKCTQMCICKEHNHVLRFVFSEDETVMNRNAQNEDALEEVMHVAENKVRKLKFKDLIVCCSYNKPYYTKLGNTTNCTYYLLIQFALFSYILLFLIFTFFIFITVIPSNVHNIIMCCSLFEQIYESQDVVIYSNKETSEQQSAGNDCEDLGEDEPDLENVTTEEIYCNGNFHNAN